jgi:hypothetical protein
MRSYAQHVSELAPLETFDPAAFQADGAWPQQVCDFMLSLALAFNDVHDLLIAHDFLNGVWPADEKTHTTELGEFMGFTQHMFRLHLGTMHEILELIEHNKPVLNDPAFNSVVNKMRAQPQTAWRTLAATATGASTAQSDLSRFLMLARNKVAFHYDRKEISKGYKASFLSPKGRQPYVSRGNNLGKSRFYFADAAAQKYMDQKANELGAPKLVLNVLKFVQVVTFALHQLVFTFVTKRGFSLAKPSAPPNSTQKLARPGFGPAAEPP